MDSKSSRLKKRWTLAGLLFTLFFTGCVLWFAWHWLLMAAWSDNWSSVSIQKNEIKAFQCLLKISRAQEKYWKQSAEALDKNQFAQFLTHLWITPDIQGRRFHMNLIPKRIALAIDIDATLNGYYFKDIHRRFLNSKQKMAWIDYQRGWAIAALPEKIPQSGAALFLADQSGNVFVKIAQRQPRVFPARPLDHGWQIVASGAELKRYLRSIPN